MKHLLVLIACLGLTARAAQNRFACKNAQITIFSSAPIEDIKAISNKAVSVFDPVTGQLDFSVAISSFQFEKSLMQEHFNSDYMESDKFPKATFKGVLNEHPNLAVDGNYPVTVTGDLYIHGVIQKRTINGIIQVKNGAASMSSGFVVKCDDHQIKIPSLVFHNIAETIKVTVTAAYTRL
jgi:hypothetical protein